ncbi:hypothetical protein [Microtetraspora malaysiensis]|uniref:hypothetical protein n=1 Tax=Microtetraspora malaysiensis TaxID=161358 RepID=UPI0012FCAE29|nr:hypothetical protein [Microtetraspora malaysiensis]
MSGRLLRYAAGRPRPLVVTAPHATGVRLLAEAEIGRRGWRPAEAPAGASLLVVCGIPEDALARAVRTVWHQIAAPKAFVPLSPDRTAEAVAAELDAAVSRLADARAQREEAVRVPYGEPRGRDGGGRGGAEHHGDEGHGGHEHDMGRPGGVRMAERGPDRDGLALDRLHVPLGPVLPYWPAGLVVETTLQGDVIQEAEVRIAGGAAGAHGARAGATRFWDEPWLAARAGWPVTRGAAARRTAGAQLDSLARLLATAGWAGAAAEARRLRDRVLGEGPREEVVRRYDRFARRVGRSRLLRWMLHDLGAIDAPGGTDVPGWARGDVLDRTRHRLAGTAAALAVLDDRSPLDDEEGPRGPVGGHPSEALLAVLPGLLTGAELAAARLIVASLDPDLDQVRPGRVTAHG